MQLEDNSQVKRPAKVVKIIQTTKLNLKIMKEIITFTKPFEQKSMYVEVTYDKETMSYELNGIDCFEQQINEMSSNYNAIMQSFYRELCWMINDDIMAHTAIQRTMPKSASKKFKNL